ncbi:SHD1 domain-containing protein [Pontiellaceae bacterium B12219]|nr:SHD1 domain-containing protein [Pontiellaceae bacterium B12219]
MKTQTGTILAALTLAIFSISANAETRVWTDAKGKTIEAELVQVLNNQVELQLTNGHKIKVSLDTLCAEDRHLAMLSQPPTLELNVSATTELSTSSLFQIGRSKRIEVDMEKTVVKVNVMKLSSAVYEEPLKAVLFIMGRHDAEPNVVLDKVTTTFVYTDTDKEFKFVTDAYKSENREGEISGKDYKGWLMAVFDSNGEVVAMKSSEPKYSENALALLEAERGEVLTAEYKTADPNPESMLAKGIGL